MSDQTGTLELYIVSDRVARPSFATAGPFKVAIWYGKCQCVVSAIEFYNERDLPLVAEVASTMIRTYGLPINYVLHNSGELPDAHKTLKCETLTLPQLDSFQKSLDKFLRQKILESE